MTHFVPPAASPVDLSPRAVAGIVVGGAFRGLIGVYQLFISPLLLPSCRFEPSCSHYAQEAIAAHGPVYGLVLTVKRLLRCHPWGGNGYDPVPPHSDH
jgi:putative membrane protein insertion efficiency factor